MPIALLQFPLRGEWTAHRTPAAGVPTHGTDLLGQRFAYDFVRPTGRRWSPYGPLAVAHFWTGVAVTAFAGWAAPVLAAAPGKVIAVRDGSPDRYWNHGWWTLARYQLGHRIRPVRITATDWTPLAGNYVLVEGADGIAFYAHLQSGSVRPRLADRVEAGDLLGAVGNSGRSSMPHLHFHLMDRPAVDAAGIECGFAEFERWEEGSWHRASGIPAARQPIRSIAAT